MHIRIIAILVSIIIVHFACFSATNFELYNSLPFPIYYTTYTQKTNPSEHKLTQLQPQTFVHDQIQSIGNVMIIVVKDLPVAGQEIPVYTISPKNKSCNIYIKTHQTKDLALSIIPQTPLPPRTLTTKGQLPLKDNIGHHEIWITKTTYCSPRIREEKQPIDTSITHDGQEQMADSTSALETSTSTQSKQESAETAKVELSASTTVNSSNKQPDVLECD